MPGVATLLNTQPPHLQFCGTLLCLPAPLLLSC